MVTVYMQIKISSQKIINKTHLNRIHFDVKLPRKAWSSYINLSMILRYLNILWDRYDLFNVLSEFSKYPYHNILNAFADIGYIILCVTPSLSAVLYIVYSAQYELITNPISDIPKPYQCVL